MKNYIEQLLKIQITLFVHTLLSIYFNAITLENKSFKYQWLKID